MKTLEEKYEQHLQSKSSGTTSAEVELSIWNIKNNFKNISILIDKNNKEQFEIITQVYCKFLLFLYFYSYSK